MAHSMFPFLIGKVLTLWTENVTFKKQFPFLIGKVLTKKRLVKKVAKQFFVSIPYR